MSNTEREIEKAQSMSRVARLFFTKLFARTHYEASEVPRRDNTLGNVCRTSFILFVGAAVMQILFTRKTILCHADSQLL